MSEPSLRDCENEVEMARAKLARDLAVLRSPATISAFTGDLKREAVETKDAVLDKVKATAQSSARRLIEDLKARTAANPVATLAIGAGIAWRMFRSPPITTILVGAGLFSLWRTQGRSTVPGERRDYLQEGKERLIAQAGQVADAARQKAVEASDVVSERAAELMSTTTERLEQLRASAGATVQQMTSVTQARAADARGRLRDVAEEAGRRLSDGTDEASRPLRAAADGATSVAGTIVTDGAAAASEHIHARPELKDIVLRGMANVALAAAVGVICKKHFADRSTP